MSRVKLSLVCSVLLVASVALSAGPPVIVMDQSQMVIDASVGGLVVGGQSEQRLAQTLTVGITGLLTGVLLPIDCESGRLLIEITTVDTAGEPTDVVLARRRIRAAAVPYLGGPMFKLFRIRRAVSVTRGEQLAIVLGNEGGTCGIFQGPAGDSYAAGQGFYEGLPDPHWIPLSETLDHVDLPFATLVRVP